MKVRGTHPTIFILPVWLLDNRGEQSKLNCYVGCVPRTDHYQKRRLGPCPANSTTTYPALFFTLMRSALTPSCASLALALSSASILE
jgi:hypothetical protein